MTLPHIHRAGLFLIAVTAISVCDHHLPGIASAMVLLTGTAIVIVEFVRKHRDRTCAS